MRMLTKLCRSLFVKNVEKYALFFLILSNYGLLLELSDKAPIQYVEFCGNKVNKKSSKDVSAIARHCVSSN